MGTDVLITNVNLVCATEIKPNTQWTSKAKSTLFKEKKVSLQAHAAWKLPSRPQRGAGLNTVAAVALPS